MVSSGLTRKCYTRLELLTTDALAYSASLSVTMKKERFYAVDYRCRKFDIPIEKVYNKTQREKFRWAIDMTDADYEF